MRGHVLASAITAHAAGSGILVLIALIVFVLGAIVCLVRAPHPFPLERIALLCICLGAALYMGALLLGP